MPWKCWAWHSWSAWNFLGMSEQRPCICHLLNLIFDIETMSSGCQNFGQVYIIHWCIEYILWMSELWSVICHLRGSTSDVLWTSELWSCICHFLTSIPDVHYWHTGTLVVCSDICPILMSSWCHLLMSSGYSADIQSANGCYFKTIQYVPCMGMDRTKV